jgi:hypothetical protein
MSIKKATKDAVYQAADPCLLEKGIKPSLVTYGMILEITGGSKSTIKDHLKAWLEERRQEEVVNFPAPPEFTLLGQEYLERIWKVAYSEMVNLLSRKFEVVDSLSAETERLETLTDTLGIKLEARDEALLANQRRFVSCIKAIVQQVNLGLGGLLQASQDHPALTAQLQAFHGQLNAVLDQALEDQTSLLSRYLHDRQIGAVDEALAADTADSIPIDGLRTAVAQQLAALS